MNQFWKHKTTIKVFLTNRKGRTWTKEVTFVRNKGRKNVYYIELDNYETLKVEVSL